MTLRVVLVRTHNPGNLGAAARAAKNFGAEIALLGPRTDPAHPDAISFASGAEDLLKKVSVLSAWGELLDQADTLVAMSSLRGRVSHGLPPPTTFEEISSSLRHGRRVALVLGPERGGLTTEELRRCDARLTIPTAAAFPTMNVAQAVAAALALLYPFEAPRRSRGTPKPEEAPAPARDVRRLLDALKATLSSAGYPGRGHSKEVLAEIESFLRRGKPTPREVTLLLGALAALGRSLPKRQAHPPLPGGGLRTPRTPLHPVSSLARRRAKRQAHPPLSRAP